MAATIRAAVQAAQRAPWAAGSTTAISTTSTSAISLTAWTLYEIRFVPDASATSGGALQKCHIRFGGASMDAATTSDFPIVEFETRTVIPTDGASYFRAVGTAAGDLYWAARER